MWSFRREVLAQLSVRGARYQTTALPLGVEAPCNLTMPYRPSAIPAKPWLHLRRNGDATTAAFKKQDLEY